MITAKTIGTDRELGAILANGAYLPTLPTSHQAATLIQSQFSGAARCSGAVYYPHTWPQATAAGQAQCTSMPPAGGYAFNYQDHSGKFLANAGCQYVDSGHPECCTPECNSARELLIYTHAGLRQVQDATRRANEHLPDQQRIMVFNDNSDRQGNAYGAHLSVQLSRQAWRNLFCDRIYPDLFFLCAFQASSIILTGGGKVGAENGKAPVSYQISRRADFMETLVGTQTTHHRPIVNSRDEALGQTARLHSIFFDAVLLHGANYLQFGLMQLIGSLLEFSRDWIDEELLLETPLRALHAWSRDPSLRCTQRLCSGRQVTAIEHQADFLELLGRFVNQGHCRDTVVDAPAIIEYWAETLAWLERGDRDRAARRIEWLAKLHLLENVLAEESAWHWRSPEICLLDLLFGALDEQAGLYWRLEAGGRVDTLFDAAQLQYAIEQPPRDTRAWTRGTLIQRAADCIVAMDWDRIDYRGPDGKIRQLKLPVPEGHGKISIPGAVRDDPQALFAFLADQCHTPTIPID